ncbi:MAG: winged helix-turn-helix domain-containing protein, partial [Caldilineaceae bacterium]|nr:winged helix-turn-helix domain-containing protein [Caldilineaceae bacterium]
KQEWQILEFLYEHVGQLCEFEEILQDVYEDNPDDVGNGAWIRESGRPKVNAAIRRLRRKLEPNPKHPRYIFTEREHGYRLEV